MTRAALRNHQPLDDEPYEARPAIRHVMAGAEGPMTPDSERPVEKVLADHANSAWGEIRMVCPLDREHATRTLEAAFRKVLTTVKGDAEPLRTELKATRTMLTRALTVLVRLSKFKEHPSATPKCGECKQYTSEHLGTCSVRKILELCAAIGVTPSK